MTASSLRLQRNNGRALVRTPGAEGIAVDPAKYKRPVAVDLAMDGVPIGSSRLSSTGDSWSMDYVIDLDSAATEITARLPAWSASGLTPCPTTWMDGLAPWPQRLETDRALIADPYSIGLRIQGTDEWAELQLVLYRGGWADLDALTGDDLVVECPRISTPAEFGRFLDFTVARFLDAIGQSAP